MKILTMSSLRYKKGNVISNENWMKIRKIIYDTDSKSNEEIDFSKFENYKCDKW